MLDWLKAAFQFDGDIEHFWLILRRLFSVDYK